MAEQSKPKRGRIAGGKSAASMAELADRIRKADSEDQVRRMLAESKLTIPRLQELGDMLGGPAARQRGSKQEIIDKISASTGGLKNRPASFFAGDWHRTPAGPTAAPAAASTPAKKSDGKVQKRLPSVGGRPRTRKDPKTGRFIPW